MRNIIILLLFPVFATAQIDQVVDSKISNRIAAANIPATVSKAVDSAMQSVVWYTEYQKSFTRSGSFNVDTLTAASNSTEVYQLTVTGAATAVRIIFVTNTGGVYSTRVVNPATWSGATGTGLNSANTSSGVVISIAGNNASRSYKYGRKNL